MTEKNAKRIRLVWGILSSVLIIVAGLCLIAACVQIYRSGDQPFSREAVAQAFQPIAIPVYLSIGAAVVGLLLSWLLPKEKTRLGTSRQDALILKRLQAGTDPSALTPEAAESILALHKRRSLYRWITAGVLIVGCLGFLSFLVSGDRFPASGINAAIGQCVVILLGCLVLPFGWAVFTVYQHRASIRQEISILKAAGVRQVKPEAVCAPKHTRLQVIRAVIACVAVGILLYGFFAGGVADVLTKAVNICTECVGLG